MRTTLLALLLACVLAGCEREDRPLRSEPVLNDNREAIALATNAPGLGGPIEYKSGKSSLLS